MVHSVPQAKPNVAETYTNLGTASNDGGYLTDIIRAGREINAHNL
jgi:hypothetical protein